VKRVVCFVGKVRRRKKEDVDDDDIVLSATLITFDPRL
jgi:hypothetical protein